MFVKNILHMSFNSVTIKTFHVIDHMTGSLVTYHLTDIRPSRTLFQVMNLVVLRKFNFKHYQGFSNALKHIVPLIIPLTADLYQTRFLSSLLGHYSILLCFIVAISRTTTTIEYPSINLVLYSYTPNEELDSWQIVLAHLTSFLEP